MDFIQLTGRQKQILKLIKKKMSYKQIAFELGVGVKAIEYHTAKLFQIFNVSDRYELEEINIFSQEPGEN